MPTTLYIIRHGETDSNYTHRFSGSTENPLNERGMAQAACLRAPFAEKQLDAVYSSPRLRAVKTAEAARGDRNIPVIIDEGLAEIHCGEWEGLNRDEIESRWPGMIELWQFCPEELHMPGGETFAEVQERTVNSVVNIVRRERGKCVAIACHMLAIQLIMAKLMSVPINKVWKMPTIGNTSVSTLRVYDNGDFEVVGWGDSSHLTDELREGCAKVAGFTSDGDGEIVRVEGRHHFEPFAL